MDRRWRVFAGRQPEDAIRSFAGEDLLKARYYPEDHHLLPEFEPVVQHRVTLEP
jgi:hypothetical protein